MLTLYSRSADNCGRKHSAVPLSDGWRCCCDAGAFALAQRYGIAVTVVKADGRVVVRDK